MHPFKLCIAIFYVALCDTGAVAVLGDKLLYHLSCELRTLDENATVGEKIRFYRMKRNIHGYTLAEQVGLSRYAIMYYENGQTEPLLEDLQKMADALCIARDKLYDDYYRFLDYPYTVRIKQLRQENGFLQRELGALLGVTRRAVERWEAGKNITTRETWEKLRKLDLL